MKPTPGSQVALFARYRDHACITDRDGETLELEADHRRDAEIVNSICDVKYGGMAEPTPLGPLRRQRRLAIGTGPMAHDLEARWTSADWSGRPDR